MRSSYGLNFHSYGWKCIGSHAHAPGIGPNFHSYAWISIGSHAQAPRIGLNFHSYAWKSIGSDAHAPRIGRASSGDASPWDVGTSCTSLGQRTQGSVDLPDIPW